MQDKINQVATMAARLPKPTKADAFDIVRGLIKNNPETDMAKLYRFFMPPTPAKAKTVFDWVKRAVNERDVREYLNYVYSDGRRVMGSDGHRIHIAHYDLEPGYYDKAGNKVDFDGRFPDIEPLLIRKGYPLDISDLPLVEGNKIFIYQLTDNAGVQKKFLDDTIRDISDIDAVSMFKGTIEAENGMPKQIQISGYFGDIPVTSVIMPINMGGLK